MSYKSLTNEQQGGPHSDDVRSLVRTLSTAETHLGQGEDFNNLKQMQFQDALKRSGIERGVPQDREKNLRIWKLNPNGGQTLTFPVAQIAKRPGIEGVKVAKVMSTYQYHTYSE